MNKKFRPKIDRLFYIVWIPTVLLLSFATAIASIEPLPLLILLATDAFTLYFLVSPLFGYVELRENTLLIKYGFIIKREIAYAKIRDVKKERRWYSDTMLSLKSAVEHVRIKYNSFDVTTVSVSDNDALIAELGWRVASVNFPLDKTEVKL